MITKYLQRWSLFVSLLFLAAGMFNPCQGEVTQRPRKGPDAAPGTTPQVVCTDERITVKVKSVPLGTILDSIAKECRLRILSPSAEKSKIMTTVDFNAIDIPDALSEVLRGCDYLVVYNESQNNTGFITSAMQSQSSNNLGVIGAGLSKGGTTEFNAPVLDKSQIRSKFLRAQIDTLSMHIASGASDRFYQQAIKRKPAKFIQDDNKMLAEYQRQLAALEQQ